MSYEGERKGGFMPADDGLPHNMSETDESTGLEALYRSYQGPLTAFVASRVSDETAAADITQTVFARLANNSAIRSIRDARQYLFQAARNQLKNYYRSRDREIENTAGYAVDPNVTNGEAPLSPEAEAIKRDKLNRLRVIIRAMPKKRRTVFLLSRFAELTDVEIADRLGMKPAAVRKHVSRAMRDCQEEMLRIFESKDGEES